MYAIGIDVSKGKSTIAININGILLEKPFEIKHTNEGFDMLLEKIKEFPKEAIKFVMEATGIYHLPILLKLLELKYFIAQMNELARELPEYDIVRKMKGVGNKICPRIIAEIGDVRKYKNANSLIASARIDTPPYQSGKFTATNIHISKRGNKYLRKCGYEIMKSLKATKPTNDSSVYDYIVKKEIEGKPMDVCKIVGLNKFLRIYYARVKEVYN